MKEIDYALNLLKRHEGYRPQPYQDTKGFWTVAYGRCFETWPITGLERALLIDRTQDGLRDLIVKANTLNDWIYIFKNIDVKTMAEFGLLSLRNSINSIDQNLTNYVDYYQGLTDERKAVMIDMTYNLGSGWVNEKSIYYWPDTNKKIRLGRYEEAAFAMLQSTWSIQVGCMDEKQSPPYGQRAYALSRIMLTNNLPAYAKD